MSLLVRRSNLLVALGAAGNAGDTGAVANAWRHNADAITLDLTGNNFTRETVQAAITSAAKGGAEVFVRVNKASLQTDLDAAIGPGLCGIMLPCVDRKSTRLNSSH